MCKDGCKCGNNQVKTEWIDMPHGEQLMFAVPPEGENEVVVDRVEELWKEIAEYFVRNIMCGNALYNFAKEENVNNIELEQILKDIECRKDTMKDIEEIFNKYRK
jgi:hypothetical protein